MPSDDPPRLPRRPSQGDGPRRSPSQQLIAARGASASAELRARQETLATHALGVLRRRRDALLLETDDDLVTTARWIAEECRQLLANALLYDLAQRPTAREVVASLEARGVYADEAAVREIVALVGLELRPDL
jgi:hypothetical protein